MKAGFLEKLIKRVDRIEPGEVQGFMIRLMQEKGFLERVFEALQEGVVITDGKGIITYLNKATADIFGLRRSASIGEPASRVFSGLDWKALEGHNKVVSRDIEVFYPANRYLNFYVSPIEDDQRGLILGRVMIIRDITRTRRVEAEKIESETLNVLTLLAAGVAHEIGNPLNSLNIHLQLAERKLRKASPPLREELRGILEISRGEIKRLDAIVKNFLSAIRPTKPNLESHDLNRLLEDALRVLEPEISDRNIEVVLERHSSLPGMRIDGDQVKQAFYNLIRNACQGIGTGGILRIRTDMDDDRVFIRFVDNGAGISPQDMANLFKPYFTTKATGSGLGLLIVRRIMREHGGEIELESEPGTGTSVTCFLPRFDRQMRLLQLKPGPGGAGDEVIDV
jgi:PAS domain S-box-containing protein